MRETVNQNFIKLTEEYRKNDTQFVIIDPTEEYKPSHKEKKIKLKVKTRKKSLQEKELLSKNLRYTIGNVIIKKYGNYSKKSKSEFENNLCLSTGCLDNLNCKFIISIDDLEKICAYLNPHPNLIFYWIKHYGKFD